MEKVNINALHKQLLGFDGNVYAVIDGAALPGLLAKLEEYEPENTCLFRGQLPFDLAEAAPYIVKLDKDNDFAEWILKQCSETPCCIFAHAAGDFIDMRKHFRVFLRVQSPEGKSLLFRYYDPRVMKTYLPTCNDEDKDVIFNGIDKYLMFDSDKQRLSSYRKSDEYEDESNDEEVEAESVSEDDGIDTLSDTNISRHMDLADDVNLEEEKTVIMRIQPKK